MEIFSSALRALALLAFALAGAAAAAQHDPLASLEQALAEGADDAVLAPLFLQAGDMLLRHRERDRAADAFEQALRRGPSRFPAAERIRIARHLAWAGRMDAAIAALRRVVAERPDDVDARLHLARYLSWTNHLLEAIEQADRVLALDPANRLARQVKANASAWRGDTATSLPLYRELLEETEEFEVRVAFTHALVGAGHVVESRGSRARLRAGDEAQRAKLAELDARIARQRSVRALAGATRYRDSDDNERRERRVGAGATAGPVAITVETEEVRAKDPVRVADVVRARVSGTGAINDWLGLRAGLGIARVSGSGRDDYLIGHLAADVVLGRLRLGAEVERDVFDETARLLENRIRFTQLELDAVFQPSDRWRLDAELEYRDFSDGNAGWRLELTPQYVLRVANPGLRVGYRRTQSAFDRRSGGGYFDPSHLHADHLALFATLFGTPLRGDVEFFVGQQVSKRFGPAERDLVLGGSARVQLDVARHFTLEAEVEGGNFSLQSSGGFSYHQFMLNLLGFF